MNYYIIPKNTINPKFRLIQSKSRLKNEKNMFSYISPSANVNLEAVFSLIKKNCENNNNENIQQIINPLEFVHSAVPGTQLSVSKLKSKSNILFEIMEIFQLCDLIDLISGPPCIPLKMATIAENYESIMDYMNIIRDGHNDIVLTSTFNYNNIIQQYIDTDINMTNDNKYHLLLLEFKEEEYNNNQYVLNLLASLYLILTIKAKGGICIIKLGDITNKVVIEIIHIINSMFLKTYLIKPNICSVTTSSRYLVCLYFNHFNNYNLLNMKNDVKNIINSIDYNYDIESIIENNIPNYFLNKLEELNAIVYQQQLESLDQTINISRNKNKEDKLEILKRNHIQKCIQWCEKNQLPHNKFIDKTNIFLNTKKKDECESN